jgi:hypothetical protein
MAPPASFWDWFKAHEGELFDEWDRRSSEWLERVVSALARYHPGLGVEVSSLEQGVRDLVVTAGGRRENVRLVDELIRAAPSMTRWRFVALRPPAHEAFTVDVAGERVRPDELSFAVLRSDTGDLGLRVYVPQLGGRDRTRIREAVQRAIHALVGERDALGQIAHLEIADDSQIEALNRIPMTKLGRFLQWQRDRNP